MVDERGGDRLRCHGHFDARGSSMVDERGGDRLRWAGGWGAGVPRAHFRSRPMAKTARGLHGGTWMNVIWCLGHIFGPDRWRRCQGACMEGRE